MNEILWKYRDILGIGLILIMHAVGILGVVFVPDLGVLPLTPVNLWLCGGAVVLLHLLEAPEDAWRFAAVYVLGFGIECLGVNTGLPFGTYAYLENFGTQWLETPWLIGMNWVFLAYGFSRITLLISPNPRVRALLGGTGMVAVDVLLEQVAPTLRFWEFAEGIVPWQNYASWWVVGALACALFNAAKPIRNPAAVVLVAVQVVFVLAVLWGGVA